MKGVKSRGALPFIKNTPSFKKKRALRQKIVEVFFPYICFEGDRSILICADYQCFINTIKTVKLKNGKFVLFINLYRKFSFQCP